MSPPRSRNVLVQSHRAALGLTSNGRRGAHEKGPTSMSPVEVLLSLAAIVGFCAALWLWIPEDKA